MFGWLTTAGGLVVLMVASGWFALYDRTAIVNTTTLIALAAAMAVAAATMAGICLFHWRAVGRVHGLLVAVAAVLLGLRAVSDLVANAGGSLGVWPMFAGACTLAAAVWVGRAIWGPEVDTRPSPLREAAATGVVVAVTLAGFVLLGRVGIDARAVVTTSALLSSLAWLVVGVAAATRSARRGWPLLAWMALGALAMAFADLAQVLARVGDSSWMLVTGVLPVAGLLVAATGVAHALSQVVMGQRADLQGVLADGRILAASETRKRLELTHEVRNALLAIEGAASTLDTRGERLGDSRRNQVVRTLHSGIASLRELVGEPDRSSTRAAFALDELVADRVAAAVARDVVVEVEALEPVDVVGRAAPVGRAIDNILLNAERHAGAGRDDHPISVTVEHHGGTGRVRISDQGPGVPPAEREAIFRPRYQLRSDASGEGLGLHVARDLIRSQSGELEHEDRTGGGASFVLSLPTAARALDRVGTPTTHEVDDGR